jgi:hypothetical protein
MTWLERFTAFWRTMTCWFMWHRHYEHGRDAQGEVFVRWSPCCVRCAKHWTLTYLEESK